MTNNTLDVDSLKLLLQLNGNKRLIHLEHIIFTDIYLIDIYITYLCYSLPIMTNYFDGETLYDRAGKLLYTYSMYWLNERWLNSEQFIQTTVAWEEYKKYHRI